MFHVIVNTPAKHTHSTILQIVPQSFCSNFFLINFQSLSTDSKVSVQIAGRRTLVRYPSSLCSPFCMSRTTASYFNPSSWRYLCQSSAIRALLPFFSPPQCCFVRDHVIRIPSTFVIRIHFVTAYLSCMARLTTTSRRGTPFYNASTCLQAGVQA